MTDTRIIAGGVFTPTLALISADQDTILGDGTPANPLHLSGGGGGGGDVLVGTLFEADVNSVGFAVRIFAAIEDDTFGRTTNALDVAHAQAVGVVSAFDSTTSEVTVTTTGEVTLTTSQWDAKTGGSGGLASGSIYYVDSVAGTITVNPTAISGQFIAQVGIARSTTVMLLSTPSFPLVVP